MPVATSNPVKPTTTIRLSYLMALLSHVRGARPATITSVTDARLRKTGNPLGPVFKRSRAQVMINWHYANAVNRQRDREGAEADFVPEPRKWGERLPKSPFVAYKGALYLECKVERSLGHEYVTGMGRMLTDADVAPYLPPKHSNADHQGVDREIILRDYKIEGIESIAIDGEVYRIDPASIPEALQAAAAVLAASQTTTSTTTAQRPRRQSDLEPTGDNGYEHHQWE